MVVQYTAAALLVRAPRARASGEPRHGADLGQPGGPREHGHDRRAPRARVRRARSKLVLAIEALCAAQALELVPGRPGAGAAEVHALVRCACLAARRGSAARRRHRGRACAGGLRELARCRPLRRRVGSLLVWAPSPSAGSRDLDRAERRAHPGARRPRRSSTRSSTRRSRDHRGRARPRRCGGVRRPGALRRRRVHRRTGCGSRRTEIAAARGEVADESSRRSARASRTSAPSTSACSRARRGRRRSRPGLLVGEQAGPIASAGLFVPERQGLLSVGAHAHRDAGGRRGRRGDRGRRRRRSPGAAARGRPGRSRRRGRARADDRSSARTDRPVSLRVAFGTETIPRVARSSGRGAPR